MKRGWKKWWIEYFDWNKDGYTNWWEYAIPFVVKNAILILERLFELIILC